ncbi:MAG: InlB B-repeat-containing protein [Clostridium sp.]|nr:MAG: InlB B-repeat-containing protein [Clostridium sp.]
MIVLLAMLGTLGLTSCGKDKPTTSSQEQVSSESSSSSSSSNSSSSSSTSTSTSSSSSSSTTSTSEPSKEVFSVTFDPLDGKMTGETTISVEDGKMVTKPADPIKIGYKFIEWQYNGEAYDFSKPVTKSITLVASYDVDNKTYTIRFNTDGGSDVESITGLKRNETGSSPTTIPTKEGFEFEAWQYNGKIYTFTEPVTSNITLVARWKVAKFNVTFDTNGGSLVATQSVEYGRKATMPATPTKENATFVGWYVKGTDVGFDFDTPVKEAISLEARWINSYTVTFLNPDASLSNQKVITFITKEKYKY